MRKGSAEQALPRPAATAAPFVPQARGKAFTSATDRKHSLYIINLYKSKSYVRTNDFIHIDIRCLQILLQDCAESIQEVNQESKVKMFYLEMGAKCKATQQDGNEKVRNTWFHNSKGIGCSPMA